MRTDPSIRRRGFTFIEMMITVAVLAIASAMVIPAISNNDDARCVAAARVVLGDLQFARNRAISLHKSHYVRFTAQQYQISDDVGLQPMDHPLRPAENSGKYIMNFGDGGTPSLAGCALGDVMINGVVSTSNTSNILGFNDLGEAFQFDGTSESALTSPATIIVQSGEASLTIQIEPATGDASVQ